VRGRSTAATPSTARTRGSPAPGSRPGVTSTSGPGARSSSRSNRFQPDDEAEESVDRLLDFVVCGEDVLELDEVATDE
jgi:hypothetical protein